MGGKWVDLAIVVVLDAKGEKYISTSTGVVFDTKYVEMAQKKGFDKFTVGSVMAAHFGMIKGREKEREIERRNRLYRC